MIGKHTSRTLDRAYSCDKQSDCQHHRPLAIHTISSMQTIAVSDHGLHSIAAATVSVGQVKTWYVQYLLRKQRSPPPGSNEDQIPFFQGLMSGDVSKNVEWLCGQVTFCEGIDPQPTQECLHSLLVFCCLCSGAVHSGGSDCRL